MWALSNTTPFPARVSAFRDHRGRSFWGLWVKATFELRPDRPALFVPDQPPLIDDPVYDGEILVADTDLAQPKPKIDVLISGAVTPRRDGSPRTLRVGLGQFTFGCDLHPPMRRSWRKTWVPDTEAKIEPVPLDARSAYGGPADENNPGGQGAAKGDAPPPLSRVGGRKAEDCVHFGPVPPTAPFRAALGGTYDAAWQARRAPLLPVDFDPTYWQSAMPERQMSRPVDPAEPLLLSGFGDLDGTYPVPHLDLQCATHIRRVWHMEDAQLQTIAIDLATRRISLTHLAVWPIASASADTEIARTSVKIDRWDMFRVRPEDVPRFAPSLHIRDAV